LIGSTASQRLRLQKSAFYWIRYPGKRRFLFSRLLCDVIAQEKEPYFNLPQPVHGPHQLIVFFDKAVSQKAKENSNNREGCSEGQLNSRFARFS
jgi:hypothetical protein